MFTRKSKLFERAQEEQSLNANHSSINNACDKLREEHKSMSQEEFDKDLIRLFEAKFKCKILMDKYEIHSKVHFQKPAQKSWFLMKYGN